MLKAVTRQASRVDAKIRTLNAERAPGASPISTAAFFDHYATFDDVAVMVMEQDFEDAHRELVPSVSAGELAHYERVRATFEGTGSGEGTGSQRAVSVSKGKGKAPMVGQQAVTAATRKGKGKAVAVAGMDSDNEDDMPSGMNGGAKGKGKGKAIVAAFEDGSPSDDEGLYD